MDQTTVKLCIKCGAEPRKKTGSYGKNCHAAYERERRERNRDAINARARELYDPAKRFIQKLKYQYNTTLDWFNQQLVDQDGKCAICLQEFSEELPPHIDHDHACCPERGKSCGKCLSGLLCSNCNNGIGRFQDDAERMERGAMYLRRTRRANAVHQ